MLQLIIGILITLIALIIFLLYAVYSVVTDWTESWQDNTWNIEREDGHGQSD